VFNRKYFYWWK